MRVENSYFPILEGKQEGRRRFGGFGEEEEGEGDSAGGSGADEGDDGKMGGNRSKVGSARGVWTG